MEFNKVIKESISKPINETMKDLVSDPKNWDTFIATAERYQQQNPKLFNQYLQQMAGSFKDVKNAEDLKKFISIIKSKYKLDNETLPIVKDLIGYCNNNLEQMQANKQKSDAINQRYNDIEANKFVY